MNLKISFYKYLFLIVFLFISCLSHSQFKLIDTIYTTFNGRTINVKLLEGKYVVLNIDKNEITNSQSLDTLTLNKLLIRSDSLYGFYKRNLGFEPPGGNPNYNYKTNIFFGNPSCGSGCGLVGAKGIEVSDFKNIFFNIKYNINVNRDVIISYELGRNFFTFSNKLLFPFDASKNERNGGFAEAFAQLFSSYAFDEVIKSKDERVFNETILNLEWAKTDFFGYINDTLATPLNTLSKPDLFGIRDPNRGFDGWNCDTTSSWSATGLLHGIFFTLGKEKLFPQFFKELEKLSIAKTKEDVMSNIAIATSKSMNSNLIPFFKNVLKFKLNIEAELLISKLPAINNKLIKYEDQLWFISPFHKIRFNLRSLNYLSDNYNYKIYLNDTLISNSKNGNNEIEYSILKNRNEVKILCQLTDDDNNIIDTFSTILSKRHNINLMKYSNKWYAYYLSNSVTKSSIKNNEEFALENVSDTLLDGGMLFYNLIIPKGRKLSISGEIKNISKFGLINNFVSNFSGNGYYSPVLYGGDAPRIGYDIGPNDSLNFYKITNRSGLTDTYMCKDRDLFMLRIGLNNEGKGVKSYFKNFILRDVTDIDQDGIVDFEDLCPKTPSIKPILNTTKLSFCSGDSLKLSITNVNKGDTIKWYFGSKTDLTNVANKIFTDSAKLFVTRTDSLGCVISSDTVNLIKYPSIKPIFNTTKLSFCSGDSLKLTVTNINKGDSLKWYYGSKSDLTNVSNKTFTDSTKLFVTRTDSLRCVISSDTIQIKKYGIPSAPTLSRDTANFLLSNAPGTTWYKDGTALTDTTQKYKPATPGSYTAKTTTNGCTSVMSAAYYYLVTDIINLSKDEFIKLAPNPFVNQLNFDFVVKGYQKLNLEVFDIASGTKVASQSNLTAGTKITLGQLTAGTYVIRVTSIDNKISYQFKMLKL